MTTLLLIRHGIAEDTRPGQMDGDRALTQEGWTKTRAAMKGLVARGLVPTRGFNSPYRRAAETMTCLQEAAGPFPAETRTELTPDGRPAKVDLWLRGIMAEAPPNQVLVVVSHQPLLSDLIFHLAGCDIDMKKASCAVISWEADAWKFVRQYQPAELRG